MINNNKETEVRNTIRDVDNKQSHLPTWQHSNIKKNKKKQKKTQKQKNNNNSISNEAPPLDEAPDKSYKLLVRLEEPL